MTADKIAAQAKASFLSVADQCGYNVPAIMAEKAAYYRAKAASVKSPAAIAKWTALADAYANA